MSLAPGTRIGVYAVDSAIGAGGMGEVYKAHDTRLKRVVALKILPPAFATDADRLARFHRESEVLASLNHPNIAHVYGLEDSVNGPAIVMEFVDGQTLADRLRHGAPPIGEALAIAKQIAEAIEYAHERGVIHRDLKPANIKLTADGGVKVLDFGLAKAIDSQTASSPAAANSPTISMAATQAGLILGTAAYMSPEQAKGLAVDRRADIWAFGVVLFEMLSGSAMFGGETASETMAQVMMKDPEWSQLPSATPRRVRELLERCLTRDPKRRLQAIGEARIALEDTDTDRTGDEVVAPRGAPWRERVAVAVATVAILASAGFASMFYRREPPPAAPMVQFEVKPAGQVVTAPALSPDGTMMAFGVNEGDAINVWIHTFATGRSTPLAGAEGLTAAILMWSPDNRSLAFSSRGKLKRIDLESHAVQVICDLGATPSRAAWSGDGTTIVLGSPETGLERVAASGGEVTPLIPLDPARHELSLTAPSFLPDGRHFFFVSRSSTGPSFKAYVGRIDAADRTELPGVASEVRFDSGHILYIHNGALVAQRFDTDRLTIEGDRVVIAEGFSTGSIGAPLSLSATGMMARTSQGTTRSQLTWVDRRGAVVGTAGPAGEYGDIELSLDERYVTYESGGAAGDIWVLDIATGVNTRVTTNPMRDADPVWSPDGKTIVFRGDRDGGHLYRRSFGEVGDDQLLLAGTDRDSPSSWSTDGRYLLFDRRRGADIWALPFGPGTAPIQITASTTFQEREAQLSPDGRLMAYESDESGAFEVYVRSFPVPGMKRQISNGGAHTARWSRDGKELFYVGPHETLTAVPISAVGNVLAVGASTPLFSMSELAGEGSYASSKSGRFLVNVLPRNGPSTAITVTMNWAAHLAGQH